MSQYMNVELFRDSQDVYFDEATWKKIIEAAKTLGIHSFSADKDYVIMEGLFHSWESSLREALKEFKGLEVRIDFCEPDETFFIGDDEDD